MWVFNHKRMLFFSTVTFGRGKPPQHTSKCQVQVHLVTQCEQSKALLHLYDFCLLLNADQSVKWEVRFTERCTNTSPALHPGWKTPAGLRLCLCACSTLTHTIPNGSIYMCMGTAGRDGEQEEMTRSQWRWRACLIAATGWNARGEKWLFFAYSWAEKQECGGSEMRLLAIKHPAGKHQAQTMQAEMNYFHYRPSCATSPPADMVSLFILGIWNMCDCLFV